MKQDNNTLNGQLLCVEFGYKQCEKGNNIELAIQNFLKLSEQSLPSKEEIVCNHCGAIKKVESGLCSNCGKFPSYKGMEILNPQEETIEEDELDKEVAELEADLWNSPTGTPPIKEQSSNREEEFIGGKWVIDPIHSTRGYFSISTEIDGLEYEICKVDKSEYGEAIANLVVKAPELAKENKELQKQNKYNEKVAYETSKKNADLIVENQALKESNTRLKEVLIELLSYESVIQDGADNLCFPGNVLDAIAKAKEALNNK